MGSAYARSGYVTLALRDRISKPGISTSKFLESARTPGLSPSGIATIVAGPIMGELLYPTEFWIELASWIDWPSAPPIPGGTGACQLYVPDGATGSWSG